MNKFEELNVKLEEFQKKFTKEGSELFQKIAKEMFETYPEVKSFSWTQYTPYFNDGEECVFRIHEVDQINGFGEYDDEENESEENIFTKYSWREEESDARAYEIVNSLREFIYSAPKDILRAIYGDHCRVTLYSDGTFEVDEYDHD